MLKAESTTNSHRKPDSHRIDDSKSVISKALGHGNIPTPHVDAKSQAPEVIEISSDHSSSSSDSEEDEDIEKPAINGSLEEESSSPADSNKENALTTLQESDDDPTTFGDLLPSTSAPIDVESLLKPNALTPHQPSSHQQLIAPSSGTLSTVLTQALRTNDAQLLESCLLLNDLSAVRGTISRLESPLAENLLTALANRLHARPGRANNLMVWLQWTLVAHGGYLAGRQGLVARLGSLQRVVRERANGLAPLLALKGRLDMLSAQMELRRLAGKAEEGSEEEGVVVYVESEEDEKVDGVDVDEESDDDDDSGVGDVDFGERSADSDDDSSEEDDSSDSEVSSRGFSDQGVDEDSSSDDEEDDEEDPAPSTKLRKGR